MGRFDGADEAEVMQSAVAKLYEYPGVHRFKIEEVTSGETQDGQPFYGAMLRVVESTNSSLTKGQTVRWASVRGTKQWSVRYFHSDNKSFLGSVLKVDPSQIGAEELEHSCTEEQPCAGAEVMAEVAQKTTTDKVTGQPKTSTKTRFFPAED